MYQKFSFLLQGISTLTFKGHDLGSGKVVLSFHQRWIASVAADGKLLLRLTRSPVSTYMPQNGGYKGMLIN
jgi:hypothetical protein